MQVKLKNASALSRTRAKMLVYAWLDEYLVFLLEISFFSVPCFLIFEFLNGFYEIRALGPVVAGGSFFSFHTHIQFFCFSICIFIL